MASGLGSAAASGVASGLVSGLGSAAASGVVSGVAGSSATAIAATVSSDTGVSLEATASGAGAVPPCCSSVKVIHSPMVDSAPGITNGRGARSRAVWEREWIGDGLPAVRSFACDEVLVRCSSTVRAHGRCESSTPITRVQSPPVPELPDLDVVADALHAALVGRSVTSVRALMPLAVRGTPAELEALAGQRVARVARAGKFLDVDLDRDRLVVNPMLTGRFQLAGRGEKAPAGTALELAFGPNHRGSVRAPGAAAWTRGAPWLPPAGAPVNVRYRDPTQMGKVYLLPAGIERPVPGRGPGEMGPDALAPALTLDVWRDRIRKHPGELKNLLRNQAFVAGIGNAYSDEILFKARLQPFRKRSSLADEEIDELYRAMRSTLEASVVQLRERVPPTFEKQVRDHLSVHTRGGQPCPRCGTRITEVKAGGFPTAYCRGCQR